jgi:hypothetical protein
MKIGEFAERADVNVQTVRYYERRGLLREPDRTGSGYRSHEEQDLTRLRFILRANLRGPRVSGGVRLDARHRGGGGGLRTKRRSGASMPSTSAR